jgi:acyl-coenzyme A synthetase/AMP-(fatty) acid ligase
VRWLIAAGADAAIIDEDVCRSAGGACDLSEYFRWGFVCDNKKHCPPDWLSFSELNSIHQQHQPIVPQEDYTHNRWLIALSAGTWLPPVGVVLSHHNMSAAISATANAWLQMAGEESVGILDLPVSASLISVALGIVSSGGKVILTPQSELTRLTEIAELYDAKAMLTTSHRVSMLVTQAAGKKDLNIPLSWIWVVGGAIVSTYRQALPVPLFSAYKIDACGGIAAWADREEFGAGKPLAGIECRILAAPERHLRADKPRLPDQIVTGEILLRGPMVSFSRLEVESIARLEANSKFHQIKSEDSWLYTGDWGGFDRAGNLHMEGNIRDMVEYSGERFSIRPIERQLISHPQIRTAALCTIEDPVKAIKAYIEPEPDAPGRPLTAHTVLSYIQKYFPHYMLPKYIEFNYSLPRNIYGEIARWQLR